MNITILIGRLTRDPYSIRDGVKLTLAVDRPPAQDGTVKTDFPTVTVFGNQADNCKRFLGKGRMVAVQGMIQTGSYQDKDGNTVYTEGVVARRVKFLDYAPREEAPQNNETPQHEEAQVEIPDSFENVDEDVPF